MAALFSNVTFTCRSGLVSDPSFPHICEPTNLRTYGVADRLYDTLDLEATSVSWDDRLYPTIYPTVYCKNDTFDVPSRDICDSKCYLWYEPLGEPYQRCTSCSLVGDQFVYDCRNLFADEPTLVDQDDVASNCTARNALGECGDFVHWKCLPLKLGGTGYACENQNRNWLQNDSVFVLDENMQQDTSFFLFCANDISGLPTSACENAKCTLGRVDPPTYCRSCTVLADGKFDFAYDCTYADLNLSCPILDEINGKLSRSTFLGRIDCSQCFHDRSGSTRNSTSDGRKRSTRTIVVENSEYQSHNTKCDI